MKNIEFILEDAKINLKNKESLEGIQINLVENRVFSKIYEMSGKNNDGTRKFYILKISTTERSCKAEYEMYNYLISKEIKCVTPVLYSEKYNYLITIKENLINLLDLFISNKGVKFRAKYFSKLGALLKEVDEKTGENSKFSKNEYGKYVLPRLESSRCFSKKEKKFIKNRINQLSSEFDNSIVRNCLVSDFSLGNIHLNGNGEIILLDMGDAKHSNFYRNITDVFLNIKFGEFNRYIENKKNTEIYFNNFIKAYGLLSIKGLEFALYKIMYLINMINFINEEKSQSSLAIKRVLSKLSNKYIVWRYKKYLIHLI